MPIAPATERRTEKLDLRISRSAKKKLEAAAASLHRTTIDFVTESALAKADELLADNCVIKLNTEQWEAFQIALDAPPRDLPRLRRLMEEPGFFDRQG